MALQVYDVARTDFFRELTSALFQSARVQEAVRHWVVDQHHPPTFLLDVFDHCEFKPTLNVTALSIDVFRGQTDAKSPVLVFSIALALLLPQTPVSTLYSTIQDLGLRTGLAIIANGSLYPYYLHTLAYLPQAADLVAVKRSCIDEIQAMKPLRHTLWDSLWQQRYKYHNALPLPLAALQFIITGPAVHFVQMLYSDWILHCPYEGAVERIDRFLDLLLGEWCIQSNRHLDFFLLWGDIMDDLCCPYFYVGNTTCTLQTAMSVFRNQAQTFYMRPGDRLLCVLHLLYHRPYALRLHALPAPLPPIIVYLHDNFSDLLVWPPPPLATSSTMPLSPPCKPLSLLPSGCSSSSASSTS